MGHSVDRLLNSLLRTGTSSGLSDAQLVRRLAASSAEATDQAFATLVERHGPMVLRVCRRLLRDPHDANDAFQATFLVLLKQSRSLRKPEAVASWLHGVALRAIRCLARQQSRRRAHEQHALTHALQSSPHARAETRELGQILHEEIASLPPTERSVVVLCDLEGQTHDQAAQALGCPVGTVKSRLAGARRRLREKLARRGFAPAAVVLSAAFAADSHAAPVPAILADLTLKAAHALSAHPSSPLAKNLSSSITTLVQGVQSSMILAKIKVASLGAALVVATSAIAIAQFGGGLTQNSSSVGISRSANQDPDRLQSLESKLDRLINALERNAPEAPFAATASASFPGGSATSPSKPATTTRYTDTKASDNTVYAYLPTAASTALEQRLQRIEARLERLEAVVLQSKGQQATPALRPGLGGAPTTAEPASNDIPGTPAAASTPRR